MEESLLAKLELAHVFRKLASPVRRTFQQKLRLGDLISTLARIEPSSCAPLSNDMLKVQITAENGN